MLDALVFDMPVKTGLKFMAPIGSDRADPERKLFDNVVHELDRTILQAVEKAIVNFLSAGKNDVLKKTRQVV